MYIKTFGDRGDYSGLVQLEAAWREMGHSINETNEPDLIYHANGLFSDAENFYRSCENKPKRIYTLLDIDTAKPDFTDFYKECGRHLRECDVACTISEFCRDEISKHFGVETEVIGYPAKPIEDKRIPWKDRLISFLHIGRTYPLNKRFSLVAEVIYNFGSENLVVVGNEYPAYGNYVGILNNEELSDFYNKSKFVLVGAQREGLCLPPIEAINGNCIPIVCNDLTTLKELDLEMFSVEPKAQAITAKIHEITKNPEPYLERINELKLIYREKFSAKRVAERIIDLYNKILT